MDIALSDITMVDDVEQLAPYKDFARSYRQIEDIESAEQTLEQTSTLDVVMVADLESRFPGIVLESINYGDRYTDVGYAACLESLQMKKKVAVSEAATAFIAMLGQFEKVTKKLKANRVSGGVASTLNTIKTHAKTHELAPNVLNESKMILAYKDFMGVEPDNSKQVAELIHGIGNYKNPIMCLKDYPNQAYDKMFSPLLANSVSDNNRLFRAFDAMNNQYANAVVANIQTAQDELTGIVKSGDHEQLSRFTKSLIPKDVHDVLNDIVVALGVEVNPSKSLLSQSGAIGAQVAKRLKVTESSLKKKGLITTALTDHYRELDEGFQDVTQATDKLSKLGTKDAGILNEIQSNLKQMHGSRTVGDKISQTINPVGRQAAAQYKRLMSELQDLWQLVNLFVRLSVAFVSIYSVIKITLDNFSIKLLKFLKTAGDANKANEQGVRHVKE